jgi:hypothetical protein
MQSSGCARIWQAVREEIIRAVEFVPQSRAHLFQLPESRIGRFGLQARRQLRKWLGIDVGTGTFQLVRGAGDGAAIGVLEGLADFSQLLVAAGGKRRGEIVREFAITSGEIVESGKVERHIRARHNQGLSRRFHYSRLQVPTGPEEAYVMPSCHSGAA